MWKFSSAGETPLLDVDEKRVLETIAVNVFAALLSSISASDEVAAPFEVLLEAYGAWR